jgi:hypothetical protein
VGFNRVPFVELLLDAGADLALTDSQGNTVLHYAAGRRASKPRGVLHAAALRDAAACVCLAHAACVWKHMQHSYAGRLS